MKKTLVLVGVALVAGALFWIFQLGGYRIIQEYFEKQPTIQAATTRTIGGPFLAGEKIRFSLQNVQSDKIFWFFDEKDWLPGDLEIEYTFGYDESQPFGIKKSHRVDVFFRYGKEYQTTLKNVVTENIKHAFSLDYGATGITVDADSTVGGDWVLHRVSLNKYEGGVFAQKLVFDIEPGSAKAKEHIGWTMLSAKLGRSVENIKTEIKEKTVGWLAYDFVNPEKMGEKLVILHPLSMSQKQ